MIIASKILFLKKGRLDIMSKSNVLSLKLNLPTGSRNEDGSPEYKDRIFVALPARGRLVRKAMELAERLSDENGDPRLDLPTLDELLQLTVDIYGNKFTLDDLYDGILAQNPMPTAMDTINFISESFTGIALVSKQIFQKTAMPSNESYYRHSVINISWGKQKIIRITVSVA